jgi:hypothetical protein
MGCCKDAAALGAWVTGQVTRAPWSEQGYRYIAIEKVRYTLMPGVKTEYLYKIDNATYKKSMDVSALQKGDTLAVMAEGNRIYQIEKTR